MPRLVWFRADLRVHDNTALWHACDGATDGVVGVFTACPRQWKIEHDWADVKVDFLLRNLRELSAALAGKNIPLKIVQTPDFAGVPEALTTLADETRADSIWFNREHEVNEQRRDTAVRLAFERGGRGVHTFDDQCVLEPGSVRTNEGKAYAVFTPFKKKWLSLYHERGGVEPLGEPNPQRPLNIQPDPVPERVGGYTGEDARPDLWPAGENAAAERLDTFCRRRIAAYHEQRDRPALDGTSVCSPYLALGVLSARQCLAAAAGANRGSVDADTTGPGTWINELIWREFYKHVLVAFPRVSMHRAFQVRTERVAWRNDEAGFEAWRQGRTGYPSVDAAMRQLNETGWMHNRLRMITASFLTKDLLVDWRRGERYFMQRLVDGDLAANNGGWQWSASTGTDAQPYFRVFNPVSQSEKYDPNGDFIRRYVPELAGVQAPQSHDPNKLGKLGIFEKTKYPRKIVEHKPARERAVEAFRSVR